MKRIFFILVIVLLALPVSSLVAYDGTWGLNLNLFSFKLPSFLGNTLIFSQTNKANFWYKGMWGNAAKIEVDGGVAFDMDWNFSVSDTSQFEFDDMQYNIYPIFNKFNFYGNSGKFGYKVGRYMHADPGKLIISAPLDGAQFSIDFDKMVVEIGVGYTGLQFNQSTSYSMTGSDLGRSSDSSLLATPRLIEYLSLSLPSITSWLSPSLFFLAVQDLSSDADLSGYDTKRINSMYIEFRSRGFLGKSFVYDLAFSGQLGDYGDSSILAGAGKINFSWLPTTAILIGIEGKFVTGDTWERLAYQLTGANGTNSQEGSQLSQYQPVSMVSQSGYVINFELGNIVSLAAFFKHTVSRGFSWDLRTTTLLRPVEGYVSSNHVPSNSQGIFIGQEFLIGLSGQPSPNFRWNVKIGALYAGDLIEIHDNLKSHFPVIPRIGLNLTFSL